MGQQNLNGKLITRLKKKQNCASFMAHGSTRGQNIQRESNLKLQETDDRTNEEEWKQPLHAFRKKQMNMFHQHSRSAVLDAFTAPSIALIAAKTSASQETLRPAKIS